MSANMPYIVRYRVTKIDEIVVFMEPRFADDRDVVLRAIMWELHAMGHSPVPSGRDIEIIGIEAQ